MMNNEHQKPKIEMVLCMRVNAQRYMLLWPVGRIESARETHGFKI